MTEASTTAATDFDGDERLLTPPEAARLLRVHPDFIRRDLRRETPRIPALVLGPRTIRYRRRGLLALPWGPRAERKAKANSAEDDGALRNGGGDEPVRRRS